MNPLKLIGTLVSVVSGMGEVKSEIALLRLAIAENTAATRENTASLKDGSTRAIVELTRELRAAALRR